MSRWQLFFSARGGGCEAHRGCAKFSFVARTARFVLVDGRAGRFLRWWGLFGAGDVIFSRSARGLCYASFLCPRPACGVISLAGDIKKNKKRRAR